MGPGSSHPCYTRAREAEFMAEASDYIGSEDAATELERNRVAAGANRRFLESRITICDANERCGSDQTAGGATDDES